MPSGRSFSLASYSGGSPSRSRYSSMVSAATGSSSFSSAAAGAAPAALFCGRFWIRGARKHLCHV